MTDQNPMTRENRLARVEGAEPTTHSVQLPESDPTPMSSNNSPTQSGAVSNLNDGKWLNQSELPERIAEYVSEQAIATKRWFKARYIADALGESAKSVGPALAAMYRSDEYPEVVERRTSNGCWVYRVVGGE